MDNAVRIIDQAQGEIVGVAGDNYRIIIGGSATGNTFSVIDMKMPPGGGPAPHAHPDIQEWFYVIDGELEYKTEAGRAIVGKGGFVYVPRGGAVHCFKNISDRNAHVLCVVLPAGLEEFFKEFGVPVAKDEFPAPIEMTPEVMDKLSVLNAKYGQTVFRPDYLD